MNLVLSGPIDPNLLQLAVTLTRPREVIRLHEHAQRLVGADDGETSRREIDRLCEIARVDHAFVPEGLRFSDFKLLAMDMDSTLITIECIDEIADFAGKKKEVAAITEAAMRGEITDFAESLRRRVALLAGVNQDVLNEVYDKRMAFTDGSKELIQRCHDANIYTLLLSGGFTYFTDRIKKELGLSAAFGNTLNIKCHKISGTVDAPILDGPEKANRLKNTLDVLGCGPQKAIAIGDGSNDIPMMNSVSHSIAFHASLVVQQSAVYNIKFGTLAVALVYFA